MRMPNNESCEWVGVAAVRERCRHVQMIKVSYAEEYPRNTAFLARRT